MVFARGMRLFRKLSIGMGYLVGFLIIMVTLVTTMNTFLRYVFKAPLSWPIEISEYIMVACTFLPASYVLIEKGHIKVDIIYEWFSVRHQNYASIATSVMAIIFCGVLTWKSGQLALRAYKMSWLSETGSGVPLFITYMVVPIGSFLLCVGFLMDVADSIIQLIGKNNEEEKTN